VVRQNDASELVEAARVLADSKEAQKRQAAVDKQVRELTDVRARRDAVTMRTVSTINGSSGTFVAYLSVVLRVFCN
jgi:hypothetical protein